jgi:hypothetical protein
MIIVMGSAGSRAAPAVLALCLLSGCANPSDITPGHNGCSDNEERRVVMLSEVAILNAQPGATETYTRCGVDDSGDQVGPLAGRRYTSSLDEPAIRSLYWTELTRDGWQNASVDIPPTVAPATAFQRGVSCLVKDIDGTRAEFTITFEPEASPVAYVVEVVDVDADHTC